MPEFRAIKKLMQLPFSDKKRLAVSDGGTVTFGIEYNLTLVQVLLDSVSQVGDDKHIVYRLEDGADQVQGYSDLLQTARCVLTGLQQQGLQPGDCVLLVLAGNHHIVPTFWACILGGFIPLIMEVPEHFATGDRAFDHLCALLHLTTARLVVFDTADAADAAQLRTVLADQTVSVGDMAQLRQQQPSSEYHSAQPDDIALFWLTSGSTGIPKCVAMTHRNILIRSVGTTQFAQHGGDDVYLNWLPFVQNGSLAEHIRCVQNRCSMVYLYKDDILSDPLNMLHTIDRYRVTHTWGPNFIYSLIRDALADDTTDYGWDLSSIQFMISGGEPVSSQIMHDFLVRTGRYGYPRTGCRPSFGMAEAGGGGMTYAAPTADEPITFFWVQNTALNGADVCRTGAETPGAQPIACLGRPIPGVSIRIVDAQHHLLPEDTVGYIHIKGDLVLNAYYRNAAANAESFLADGWFDTGDLGFLSEGNLALTGRAKTMLIIHGSNYYSHEIEAVVEGVPGVERSFTAACAIQDADSDTDKLAIFFHAAPDHAAALSALIRTIRQAVVSRMHLNPDYLVPVEQAEVPKTPIGKIRRNLLAERFRQGMFADRLQRVSQAQDSVAPRNLLEQRLADAWEAVLKVRPGIHDNFFDLGGNSIKAVMVMNQFQAQVAAIFHPVSLFDAPTIAELADYFTQNYPRLFQAADVAEQSDQSRLTEHQIAHMQRYLQHSLSSPAVQTDLSRGKNPRAVFILSPARSGSTLLRVILAGNPHLFSPPELYLMGFNRLREHQARYTGRLAFLREGVLRAVMALQDESLEQTEQRMAELAAQDISVKALFGQLQAWAGERLLVDKTPPYAFNPDILQRLEAEFDDPLYIHLMRHPAGMIASFEEVRVDLAVDVHGDEDGVVPLSARQKGEAWWLVSHQNIRHFLQTIPAERQHLVKFEDLAKEPEPAVQQLCDFLGVPFHADMLAPQADKQRRMTDGSHQLSRLAGDPKFHTHQGISAEAADRWQRLYTEDFLSAQTWQMARQYGYRFAPGVSLSDFQVQPDPANRHQPFPLTDIQQAYWAGRVGSFELGGYSVHSYTEIDSVDLNIRRLQQAWQRMVDRHEMLRTIILPEGQQQILDTLPRYHIRVQDLSYLDEAGVQAELAATREQLSHQVFVLDQWPLYEIRVSRLDARHCRVHLSFDAILFDARSRYIIFSEFRQFYQQPDLQLPTFELSFRDYVLAEQCIKDSPLYQQSRDYWLEQLTELPGAPELPLAINPATLQQPKFIQKNHFFAEPDWTRLKGMAARSQISPSCLLLTAFSDVLRLWNKQDRFTINLTAYNRQPLHAEVNQIIGDFTSIILLAIDAAANDTFITRAHRLQKRLWNNINHNHFSGVDVLRELSRRQDHPALMPVVFTSVLGDEINETGQQTTDWLGKIAFNVAQTPQIWFDHIAFEEGGGLLCRWNVIDTLFPAGMMDAMFAAYIATLQHLLEQDAAWQHEVWPETAQRLVTAEQLVPRQQANATDAPVSGALMHTLFAEQVVQRPQAPAVIAADRTLSYLELSTCANQIGHRLRALGVQPNQLVAIVLEKGWQQVVAVMGTLVAGGAYLPIDPALPEERQHHLLAFGDVQVVLTDSTLDGLLHWPTSVRRVCVDDSTLASKSCASLVPSQKPEDLAYVIFTSGSTGLPKGVMIDHRGAVNTLQDINDRFRVGPQDRAIALSALNFDLSVYDIFGLLAAGGAVVMPQTSDVRNPDRWLKLVNEQQVTIWNTVPAFVGLLTDYVENHPDSQIDALRLIMMSGDWIPITLPGRIRQHSKYPEIISLGGATEASIWSIQYPITTMDPAWTSIPYGKPLRNQQLQILNSALEPCPVWVPGKLYIGGIGLAQGYWRDAEKTATAFIHHPATGERLYCTGDLGRYLPDGNIEFLGREDFQVKIQGFRVELGEIEAALMQHPGIRTAVVDARGADQAEKQLVAYYVAESGTATGTSALQTFLQQKLPGYMMPTVIMPLDALPLSANGKVDRKALPEPVAAACTESGSARPQQEPAVASGVATELTQIVEAVLGQTGIGATDNLFHFGATSIHMMRIVNQLEKQLHFRPQMDAFYESPSIQGLLAAYTAVHGTHEKPDNTADAPAWLDQFDFIADPEQRAAFKARQPGIRQLDVPALALTPFIRPDVEYAQWRSYRHFSSAVIAPESFSQLLAALRQADPATPKYLYGSAGGLYPVQTYLSIKPGRIATIDGGVYYYHPIQHQLLHLSDSALDERIYNPHINRPVYQRAAFAIFLVAQLSAIAPMYQDSALHFATLEAGLIAQLLRTQAPDAHLGVCEMGELDFDQVRHLFDLDDSHRLLHSLVGGIPEEPTEAANPTDYHGVFTPYSTNTEDREEEEF